MLILEVKINEESIDLAFDYGGAFIHCGSPERFWHGPL